MKPIFAVWSVLALSVGAGARQPEPGPKPEVEKLFSKHTFTKAEAKLPYRLMKPAGYDADAKTQYPLVIFLHGMGERGNDNTRQLINGVQEFATKANREKYACFLVVPQCAGDKTWSAIRSTRADPTLAEQPSEPAKAVLGLIDELAGEYRIDRDRIYLTGISMGGYGTWDLIARHPDRFAAAVPVCGGGDPKQAAKLIPVPIWAFHGGTDSVVPPERSRDMIAAIKAAGGSPKYTEFENVGHNSWTPTYKTEALFEWLFQQKKAK